jgi:signal transduction histidine kinase
MGLKLIQGLRERHEGAPGGQPQILNPVDEGDENVFDMADEIKESCDIAINILNDLLLYEKMEGGLLVLEKKPEPALDLVYEVRSQCVRVCSINYFESVSRPP